MLSKIGALVKQYRYHIFLGICIISISYLSYRLGGIKFSQNTVPEDIIGADIYTVIQSNSPIPKPQISTNKTITTPTRTPIPKDPRVVVSKKSSSKVYHYSWCSSAKRIKADNQIWFNDASAAQAAGYTLAGNCKP